MKYLGKSSGLGIRCLGSGSSLDSKKISNLGLNLFPMSQYSPLKSRNLNKWFKKSVPAISIFAWPHPVPWLQIPYTESPWVRVVWLTIFWLYGDVKVTHSWASLVAQWLRIRLPTQGTRVQALVREDPTCRGATKPMRHNYWACALEPVSHNYWSPHATTTEPSCHNYWSPFT